MRVPKPYGDYLILKTINASHGTAVAVSDQRMLMAMRERAKLEGIWACPEGSATYASLIELIENGAVDKNERILLYNTGSGLLYPELANSCRT